MAIVLVSTIADEYANSYISEEDADVYWEDHYSSTRADQWSNLSSGQKQTLLVQACLMIESIRFTKYVKQEEYSYHYDMNSGMFLMSYQERIPIRYSVIQALQFPRNIDVDSTTGVTYIPESVKYAQCEQALYIMNFDESAISASLQGIVRESVSIGRGQIQQSMEYSQQMATMFSPVVVQMLKPYFCKTTSRLQRA
jgi:hypothetical protein